MSDAASSGLAAGLLGAEVVDRAERRARQRHLRLGDRPGDPEVGDLHPAVAVDHDVARLHVAMDDAPLVGRLEGARRLGGDPGGLARRQGAGALDDRGEVLAVDELHDDERPGRRPGRSRRPRRCSGGSATRRSGPPGGSASRSPGRGRTRAAGASTATSRSSWLSWAAVDPAPCRPGRAARRAGTGRRESSRSPSRWPSVLRSRRPVEAPGVRRPASYRTGRRHRTTAIAVRVATPPGRAPVRRRTTDAPRRWPPVAGSHASCGGAGESRDVGGGSTARRPSNPVARACRMPVARPTPGCGGVAHDASIHGAIRACGRRSHAGPEPERRSRHGRRGDGQRQEHRPEPGQVVVLVLGPERQAPGRGSDGPTGAVLRAGRQAGRIQDPHVANPGFFCNPNHSPLGPNPNRTH